MNILQRLGRFLRSEGGDDDEGDDSEWIVPGGKGANVSGVVLAGDAPLLLSAVMAAVRILAEPQASIPWEVIQREGDRRRVLDDHQVAWLLNTTPDGEMTSVDFITSIVSHALLWGGGYASIRRALNQAPYSLHLLQPHRVRPVRNEAGELQYEHRNDWGDTEIVPAADMFHLHGLGYDGLRGYSVVHYARQSFGLTQAQEAFAASFFGNGTHPSGVLTTDGTLKEEQVKQLRAEWDKVHKGNRKKNKTAILSGGLKWQAMTMPLEDAQFLESRRFQILEVARWFRVPPHMLAELERATHTNVEQMQIEFVTHSLLPWVRRFEAEADMKLLGRNQRSIQRVRGNLEGLLRGDMKTRYESYRTGIQNGFLSPNDARRLEKMNPIPGGDDYYVQTNLAPVDLLRQKVEADIKRAEQPPAPPTERRDPENADDGNRRRSTDADEGDQPDARLARMEQRLKLINGGNGA